MSLRHTSLARFKGTIVGPILNGLSPVPQRIGIPGGMEIDPA